MNLSRRQREALLDEMARMIANKQYVSFANHAKIAEKITNNELSLYINSINKEFHFKDSDTIDNGLRTSRRLTGTNLRDNRETNNIIKIIPKDLTISNINKIIFHDKSIISGITDETDSSTLLQNSSQIAISLSWAKDRDNKTLSRMKKYNPKGISGTGTVDIIGITDENKYNQQHLLTYEYWQDNQEEHDEKNEEKYDNKYAFKQHTHTTNEITDLNTILETKADKQHTHTTDEITDLNTILETKADKIHTHISSEITDLQLLLDAKAEKNHKHADLYLTKPEIIDLIKDETTDPWYSVLFKGLRFVNDVAQDGYIYWLQTQVNAIYGILAEAGLVEGVTSGLTGIGAFSTGIASKIETVADVLNFIGEKVPKLNNIVKKVVQPLQTVSEHLKSYNGIMDIVNDVKDLFDFETQIAHHISDVGDISQLTVRLLPDTVETLTNGLHVAEEIVENGYMEFLREGAHSAVAL